MDRRETLRWIVAAVAAVPSLRQVAWGRDWGGGGTTSLTTTYYSTATGYGTDPDLLKTYSQGDLWPLTFTSDQRSLAALLCDLIIPAEGKSPSASAVGTVDFIDEWISAPYQLQQQDRKIVLRGCAWLDRESKVRFSKRFIELDDGQHRSICDEICNLSKVKPLFLGAARFFSRYRSLTAAGFYTTPAGRVDIGYVGNVSMSSFEGPPPEVLNKVGLTQSGSSS